MKRLGHGIRTQVLSIFLLHHLLRVDSLTCHTPHPNAGNAISLCSSLEEENISQKPQVNVPSGSTGQDWVT